MSSVWVEDILDGNRVILFEFDNDRYHISIDNGWDAEIIELSNRDILRIRDFLNEHVKGE